MVRDFRSLRVWLVHDWLTGFRGGEKILLELVRMFPRARIATLVHIPGATHPEIDERVARTSFLQGLPGAKTHYRRFLPLFPRAIRSMGLDGECDLVLSVSHAVAKGVSPPKDVPHICYCNTPMRYIWGMDDRCLSTRLHERVAIRMLTPMLRRFDRRTGNVTAFIANSRNVAGRIERCYRRASEVVYAGIDHQFFSPPTASCPPREDFYLAAGALVSYKRVDLAVRACMGSREGLGSRRLVVIGTGPEERRLRQMARRARNITFLGRQPDEVLRDHYRRCRAFVFPGEEDFGLTPIEAQACGAPVIAYRGGGALETVSDAGRRGAGATGVFFEEQTPEALRAAMERLEAMPIDAFATAALRENARRFTWETFRAGIVEVLERVLGERQVGTPAEPGADRTRPSVHQSMPA